MHSLEEQNRVIKLAWEIYCFETMHDLHVVDEWDDLSDIIKTVYLTKAELKTEKDLTIKQVIVLRKDLNMRKGKMVAQGARASMTAVLRKDALANTAYIPDNQDVQDWLRGAFTEVCCGVDSEEELLDVYHKAKLKYMNCSLITDSGKTEFNGVPTNTAVAVGPAPSWQVDTITGGLKLL